ncbi:MAG: TonB-dependent receptor [Acidiferrobacterales bacterium]
MKKYSAWLAVLGTACAIVQISYAAEDQQSPIIVTATRTAETADESLASVTVITRANIDKSGAQSVPEVLSGVAGVDITTSGGFGKLTSVFMRGTASTQVLVLVDGIEVGSVTSGATAWEFLPISEIERIEIVRGPRSTLYGSQAIGGVIQIFTRKGEGPPQARVVVSAGSNATSELTTGFSGSTDTNWFNVSVSRFRTNGTDAREPTVEFGMLLDEPDEDGFDYDAFSARFGHRFANAMEIEVHALESDGNTEFDSAAVAGNEDDFTQQVVGIKYRARPTARWNVLVEAGRSTDERRTFRDGSTAESQFDSEIRSVNWQNDLTFGSDHIVTLGADFRDDRASGKFDPAINNPPGFKKRSRDDLGVFSQYQGNFAKHDILLGLREDDNEQFGHHTTGNIAWSYAISNPTRVFVSYGTAFRAPTFNDLFFPDFFGFPSSNPNLDPERSKSLETGLRGKHAYGRWDVRAYRTEIDDLIALDANFIPQNIDETTIEGLEAEISANIADWIGRAALSYVDPRDDATDNILARRAQRSLRLDLDRRVGKTEVGLSLIAQSRRYDDAANTIKVPGYGILNLRAVRRLSKNWQLRARIKNIFDKEYQTIDTFNTLGRNIVITLAYQPSDL